MAYAVPPGDDDDLMNVLRLRAMGGRTSRTVGAGYWKVEKTVKLPTAAGAGSSKMAPHGTCAKLSFISRPPGGPEGRNGWLMKQYLLPHAPGAPAGPALCKLYFKKSAVAATAASTTAAAAAGKATAAARPSRLPASASSPTGFLQKPAAEAPSTAVPPATKAATSQDAGARPLRLRVPTSTTYASRLRLPASVPYPKILKKPPARGAIYGGEGSISRQQLPPACLHPLPEEARGGGATCSGAGAGNTLVGAAEDHAQLGTQRRDSGRAHA